MEPLQRYAYAVEEYSSRRLSYPSDVEAAFTGVSNILAEDMRSVFTFGLPHRDLAQSLLWTAAGRVVQRKSSPEYPSWSWMGWIGPVTYASPGLVRFYDKIFNFSALVHFYV